MKWFGFPVSFVAPLILLGVSLIWALFAIVLKNLNAKDVVFSFSALVAAFAMFCLNIGLGMREDVKEYVIQTRTYLTKDLVIDLETQGRKSDFIVTQRESLSKAVGGGLVSFRGGSKEGVNLFTDQNLEQLELATRFFYLNSVLGSMLMNFPDWQGAMVQHRGGFTGSFNAKKEGAGRNSFIGVEELDEAVGNVERGYTLKAPFLMAEGLTLPPETRVYEEGGHLTFENPFLLLQVSIYIPGNYRGERPDSNVAVEYYPNIHIRRVMKRERSGSPEYEQYVAWADKVYEHLRAGFE